jgi:uncharacterized protein with von Willebrand factor type A (vWA) domain
MFRNDPEGSMTFQDTLLNNGMFLEMMKLLGRWKASMEKEHRDNFVPVPTAPMGLEHTNNISNMTTLSRAMLAHPSTKKLMILKLLNHQAPGYKRGELEGMERGGIYILIDCSGSMGGGRLSQAVAFSGAMCLLAWKAKRDVRVSVFNMRVTEVKIDLSSLASTNASLKRLCHLTASGGTNFNPALKSFLDLEESFRSKSDVVIISDGAGPLDDSLLRAVQEQASLTYIVVKGGTVLGKLAMTADQVLTDADLLEPSTKGSRAATRILRGVKS